MKLFIILLILYHFCYYNNSNYTNLLIKLYIYFANTKFENIVILNHLNLFIYIIFYKTSFRISFASKDNNI